MSRSSEPRMVLGLDIGGTKLEVGLMAEAGRLLRSIRQPAGAERGPEAMLADLIGMARRLSAELDVAPAAAGVSIGGPLDPDRGLVICPPHLPGWIDIPLQATLEAELGVPVTIDNDANAAAIAEHRWGAGRGLDTMLYITVSTGIGAGVIVHGRLLRGVGCGAGEIGHTLVRPDGRLCRCGSRGCLEAEASGTAIAAKARAALAAEPERPSSLREAGRGEDSGPSGREVAEGVRQGDALCCEVWDDAMAALGIGVANAIHTLAPERVVIGGGIAAAGDIFFGPLRQHVAERVHLVPAYRIGIVPSAFGPEQAGLMGALALAAISRQPSAVRSRGLRAESTSPDG